MYATCNKRPCCHGRLRALPVWPLKIPQDIQNAWLAENPTLSLITAGIFEITNTLVHSSMASQHESMVDGNGLVSLVMGNLRAPVMRKRMSSRACFF